MKELFPLVSKPVRYIGQEINAAQKAPSPEQLRFCLAFPDVYEVGMSHLGLQILYHLLNGLARVHCERAFAPWVDMERMLREKGVPLSSLDSSTPLRNFDILGFSLQYELSFTNVLNMLDLARIPLLSRDRDDRFPLVIAGGPTVFNPAPVADFFDAMVLGDGEEVIVEICNLAIQAKGNGAEREILLRHLAQLEGVYVPSLHGEEKTIRKRIVTSLEGAPFPRCPIVPYMKVIHDRLNVEIARGCKRGCRFCAAGFIHRPYRERSPQVVEEVLASALKQTGYEEVSLLSLSAGDYAAIEPLLTSLMDRYETDRVALSFPSLRIENVVKTLAAQVKRVRKTGFTIAPEAGTERLRRVINKDLDEATLSQGVADLFSKGWKNIKLYFMMGLPSERDEDLGGIVELAKRLAALGERQRIHPHLSVSVSTFVPKPHTPFQWASQAPLDEMKEKLHRLREDLRQSRLQMKWQDPHLSFLEGIFSSGDRTLSRVLMEAHRLGCRFDGWSDQFRFDLWREAFKRTGVPMDGPLRKRDWNDPLPWSFIDTGVRPAFLWEEGQRALKGELSPPCHAKGCSRCGVCDGETVRVVECPPKPMRGQDPIGVHADLRLSSRPLKEGSRAVERAKPPRTHRDRRRIRLKFTKREDLRFISHLELTYLFHRAVRRAGLPLSYSEGFHPMPRIVFARALPVGVESLSEVVVLDLEKRVTPQEIAERLNGVLPRGLEIVEAQEVSLSFSEPPVHDPAVYWITLDHLLSKEEATTRVKNAFQRRTCLIHQERKGKKREVDVLPLIERMEVREKEAGPGDRGPWGIELALRSMLGRSAKPLEVIGATLGLEGEPLSQCDVIKVA